MIIANHKNTIWGKGAKNLDPIPKIIWIYWEPITPSILVDMCINQINTLLQEYEINIVNKDNIKTFLPNLIPQRDDLPFANYSDIIRLNLLVAFGGIWIDASILITENFDWIYTIQKIEKVDLIGFFSDFFSRNINLPILETWLIATSSSNKFINDWKNEYEKCYTSSEPHRYFDLEKKDSTFTQGIDENLSNYLIVYLAAMKIMRNNNNYRIFMISASETGHYYNFGLKLKPHQLVEVFLLNGIPKKYPKLIKFERRGREAIDQAIKRGRYNKKSYLFQIIPDRNYYRNKLPRYFKYIKFILENISRKYKS